MHGPFFNILQMENYTRDANLPLNTIGREALIHLLSEQHNKKQLTIEQLMKAIDVTRGP